MRKKISLMLPLLCASLAFWACGGGESNSGTSANGSVSEADLVVATFDDLPVCSGKREGATAYVKDEKTAYICEDGKWISDDETDGDDSSSSVKPGSSSSKKDDPKSSSSRYGTMTDTRDNKTYKTVKIGDQVWMAENLNYADSTKMPSLKGKSWCFNNKAENCDVTGRLYTWAAAIDSVALANDADNPQTCGFGKTCTLPAIVQGVCPAGWHLPSKAEFESLLATVGTSKAERSLNLRADGWGNGSDMYGFSALPAGFRDYYGDFYDAGYYAYFWSASQFERISYYAYSMYLGCDDGYAYMYDSYKVNGNSVRCLQNN